MKWYVVLAAIILGPLSSGSPQGGGGNIGPVVTSQACTIALPVTNGVNVPLVGGGACAYSATCSGTMCTGVDAVTSWAITSQSCASCFSITAAGVLQGGANAANVVTGSDTVTVTATNTTGTSPGVVQTITAFQPPVVASLTCTIKSPITNGVNVVLQAGGSCQYTATCAGGACSGGNAISNWAITSQSCTSCYSITSSGILQGGANAANVGSQIDTVTVTAVNAGGTSPGVTQSIHAVGVPVVSSGNFSSNLPLTTGQAIGTMSATNSPTSWAITAVSGDGASTADFAISSGGAITTTSHAPTDITSPGVVAITVTATNLTGTSSPGNASLTLSSNVTPVVALKACTVSSGFVNGQTVNQTRGAGACTYTATCGGSSCSGANVITGWAISSQSCTNCYAINSSGTLLGGASAINVTNETDTVTVKATNSSGTSSGVTQTITAYLDGSVGAVAAANSYPTLFTSTSAVPGVTNPNAPYPARPPWNVAGVDYTVGIPTGTVLKNVNTMTTADCGPNCSISATQIRILDNGITLTGWDFCNGNNGTGVCWTLDQSNSGLLTVKNSLLGTGTNLNAPMIQNSCSGSGNCFLTLTNSTINGFSRNDNFGEVLLDLGNGPHTFMYNAFLNGGQDEIDFNGAATGSVIKYNLFVAPGQNGGHADVIQASNGGVSVAIDFNTVIYNCNAGQPSCGSQGFGLISCCGGGTWLLNNSSMSYNSVISYTSVGQPNYAFGTQLQGPVSGGSSGGIASGQTVKIQNNYMDPSGVIANNGGHIFNTLGGSVPVGATFTQTGNVNLHTGAACAADSNPPAGGAC